MNLFKEIIEELTPAFKQRGFAKKSHSFYIEVDKNYGVINFQKSRESTEEAIKFTINFGVYSHTLRQLEHDNTYLVKPEVEQCHWSARVGNFMLGSPDYWWIVNVGDDLNHVISSIIEVVENIIMPEINKRLDDQGLINCWLNEAFAGTTEIGRFKYLTTLLKDKGDVNILNQIIEVFMAKSKGSSNVRAAMEHLNEIEHNK